MKKMILIPSRFNGFFAAFMVAGALLFTAPGVGAETVVSTKTAAKATQDIRLPKVLSSADEKRYRKIFALQEKGAWPEVDELIHHLEDKLLMGHVQAQRFLHPTKYRSKYVELKDWLDVYGDHHYARQLYKLALKRRPKNYKHPKVPPTGRALRAEVDEARPKDTPPSKKLTRAQRQQAYRYKVNIRSRLRKGHTKAVKNLLTNRDVLKVFSSYDEDWGRARLAKAYFMDGRDEWAVEWADKAIRRSGRYLPEAHWTAGLASWRLGNPAQAANYFENAAKYDGAPWTHSASAFWAARAHLLARQPQKVTRLLQEAAEHPRTFYGTLANRLLGVEPDFNWEMPPVNGDDVAQLKTISGGRRALALLQVGENVRAERELRQVAKLAPLKKAKGIMAIASQTGMAELTMRLDAMLYPEGSGYDGAAYPLPAWAPEDGFKVDRALIYALVRQESRFNPKAKSSAGARGLMQLMPRTAGYVARDKRYRWSKRSALFDPEHNLALGQRYIQILLSDKKINGDLFLMAAAWNGGPGNLNKWRRKGDDLGDALFFIESLPARETRNFIEHVLTNLWIYRHRLNQHTPSLEAVAAGQWPQYESQGSRSVASTK